MLPKNDALKKSRETYQVTEAVKYRLSHKNKIETLMAVNLFLFFFVIETRVEKETHRSRVLNGEHVFFVCPWSTKHEFLEIHQAVAV